MFIFRPPTRHDLDLILKPEDAERALETLEKPGMRPERPPEEWLLKARDGDTLVDLIYCPKGLPVDDELIGRGEELSVLGMDIRVMALKDVMATKLLADVRARTAESPLARAFFVLLDGLEIVPDAGAAERTQPRVRIVTPHGSTATQGG
jgi:hypothetical protein